MVCRSLCFSILLAVFGCATGFDPFEGTQPIVNCLKCRENVGCNITLLEAYKETEASKTDKNINEADTKAYLFTRKNKKHPECLHLCGGNVPPDTLYNANKETVIIIGGHLTTVCTFAYFREIKTQLLCRDDYNVILIDWPWGNGPDIYGSQWNTEVVGKQVAFLIRNIMTTTATTTCEKIHIIGHAYGAHAAGYVGRFLKDFCNIGRITGLDPFGGVFIVADEKDRLDPSDASYVDVIHTGAGSCFPFWLGTTLKSGHADFYPNGGSVQMSCMIDAVYAFLKGDFMVGVLSLYPPACYLFQSIRYFLASINPCRCLFIGVECANYEEFKSGRCRSCTQNGSKCAVMGMDFLNYPHQEGNRSYYLDTTLQCPYCKSGDIDFQGFSNHTAANSGKLHCCDSSKSGKKTK